MGVHSRTLRLRAVANLRVRVFIVELRRSSGDACERCSLNDNKMPNQKQKRGGEAGNGIVVQMPRKSNPRQEYRVKQRARIEASPVLAKKFPRLRGLKVTLEYFDAAGTTKNGEMKCKLNVELARSAVWFACRRAECMCGDFDLSGALAEAVGGRRKVATGELRCRGTRRHGNQEPVACGTVLRYKLNLDYD